MSNHPSQTQVIFRTPSPSVLVRAGLWLMVVVAGIWFVFQIHFTVVVFGLAWLIAYLMNPVVVFLEGRKLGPIKSCSRGLAVAGIYSMLVGLLLLGSALLIPQVVSQVNNLLRLQNSISHPEDLANLVQTKGQELLSRVPQQYREQLLQKLSESTGSMATWLGSVVVSGINALASFVGQVVAGAVIFVSALLVSVYMLMTWKAMGQSVIDSFPSSYRDEMRDLLRKMNAIFGGYLRATILTSAACALCTLVVIWALALGFRVSFPYALVVSLVAGLTYPVPVFGILASTVLAGVLAFISAQSLTFAITVALAAFVVNNILDRTLQPKLMSDAIGVSPLFVMFAAAAGGEFLGGVWGMLLGIPLAAMAKAVFSWFHARFLVVAGDEAEPTLEVVAAEPDSPSIATVAGPEDTPAAKG